MYNADFGKKSPYKIENATLDDLKLWVRNISISLFDMVDWAEIEQTGKFSKKFYPEYHLTVSLLTEPEDDEPEENPEEKPEEKPKEKKSSTPQGF